MNRKYDEVNSNVPINEIKELYDELKTYNPHKHVLYFEDFKQGIINKLLSAVKDTNSDFDEEEFKEILEDVNNKPQKRITKEEEYILNSKKIKNIEVYDYKIPEKEKSASGYQDLSFSEFLSYLFWRTQIRRGKHLDAPSGFVELYLIELCNFVEFEGVEKTKQRILMLAECVKDKKHSMIYDALSDFLVYYGENKELIKYDKSKFQFEHVKESLAFLNGTHDSPFDFITYAPQVENSKAYQENPTFFRERFLEFFLNIVNLLKRDGVDLIPLWVGKYTFDDWFRSSFIKIVNREKLIEKTYEENGILLRQVTKDGVKEARMDSQGQDIDPGQRIFGRYYIIKYPLIAFEHALAGNKNRELERAMDTIKRMQQYGEHILFNKIVNLYESEEFVECINKCIK